MAVKRLSTGCQEAVKRQSGKNHHHFEAKIQFRRWFRYHRRAYPTSSVLTPAKFDLGFRLSRRCSPSGRNASGLGERVCVAARAHNQKSLCRVLGQRENGFTTLVVHACPLVQRWSVTRCGKSRNTCYNWNQSHLGHLDFCGKDMAMVPTFVFSSQKRMGKVNDNP